MLQIHLFLHVAHCCCFLLLLSLRYVEDHTNNLVRTFTGNLTAMLSTMGTNGVNSPTAHMASSRSSGGAALRSRFAPDSARSKSAGGALVSAQQGSAAAAAAAGSVVPGKAVSAGGGLAQTYSLPVKKKTPRQQWVKNVLSKGAAADAAAAAAAAEATAVADDADAEHAVAEANTNSSSEASNNKRPGYAVPVHKHGSSASHHLPGALKGALARRGSREGRRSSSNGGSQRKLVVMSDGVEVIPTCSIPEGCEDSI
jgi:hypothetical protein